MGNEDSSLIRVTETPPAATHTARNTKFKVLCVGAAALVCVAAWVVPGHKQGAVAGRLAYWQFLLALVATAGFVSALILALAPATRLRPVAFRIAAVWLGVLSAILIWEGAAYLMPPRHEMDNPWYILTRRGVQESEDMLPFERPPHLKWEGMSRGDLAILNHDDDPSARPVSFATDFEGFRNGQDIEQADLIFLGDSFTEAGNVPEEETFVRLTAQATGLSTRNLGRALHTGPTELLVLKKYGLKCQPRIVIWQLTEANDLEEAVDYRDWIAAGRPNFFDWLLHERYQLPREQTNDGGARTQSWERRSPTFRLFSWLRTPKPWTLSGTFCDKAGQDHEVRFSCWILQQHIPVNHAGWPLLEQSIKDGAKLLRDHQIRLIVVHIPVKIRVVEPWLRLSDAAKARRPQREFPPEMTLAYYLNRLCRELDVPFVDATPALKDATAAGELVYLPFDTHLSPRGHEIVSKLVVDALRKPTPGGTDHGAAPPVPGGSQR
jgi:hypothetical protein